MTLSRPGRAVARRADGDVPFDDARTRDCLPSQLGRTTGGDARERGFPRSNRQSRTTGERPTGECRRATPPSDACRRRIGLARVSGIRPSDRRGPGPAGHRGRNVRSTGRCSYNLRITRRRADSCGLHRSTSQVIRRSGFGVFLFFSSKFRTATPRANTRRGRAGISTLTIFRSTLGRGSRRAGGRRTGSPSARGHGVRIRRTRDRQVFAGTAGPVSNDPSAGSPTETLLRLLLPLNGRVRSSSRSRDDPAPGGAE